MSDAKGMTAFTMNVGLSTVTGVSMLPFVLSTQLRQMTGTSLFISGIGTAHASMFVGGGAPLGISLGLATWTKIDGPAGFQLAAGGATAIVSVIQELTRTPDV